MEAAKLRERGDRDSRRWARTQPVVGAAYGAPRKASGENVLAQFTLVTLLMVATVSALLGWLLSARMKDTLLRSHVDLYPEVIRSIFDGYPEVVAWMKAPPGGPEPPGLAALVGRVTSFEDVFRVKVWGRDGTILWSDNPEIVGRSFADDPNFQEAMRGNTSWLSKKAPKRENAGEASRGILLEIYTPVLEGGVPVGVLELYESDDRFFEEVRRGTSTVWLLVLLSGATLYAMLFLVFRRAHHRQLRAHEELVATQDVTIRALAYQSEIHDIETGNHLERTTRYVRILADELSRGERDRRLLTRDFLEDLTKSAPLHDIGKVGVPDDILRKPGKLNPEEFAAMQKHCEYGSSILRCAESKLSFASFLKVAIEITQHHHEKWDGTGYPTGLHGEDIPLAARIMTVADVYDALRSQRYYKKPLPHDRCREILIEERGKAFDPMIVDAFLRRESEFVEVSRQLVD